MAIVLALILLSVKLLIIDFGSGTGDGRKGPRYISMYSAIFAGIMLSSWKLLVMGLGMMGIGYFKKERRPNINP